MDYQTKQDENNHPYDASKINLKAFEMALRASLPQLEEQLKLIEEAKTVRPETLRIQFTI